VPIKKFIISAASGLAILLLLPLFVGEYVLLMLILIFINVLLASSMRVSLNAGLLNFGISAFMAIGAYGSALMAMKLGLPALLSFFLAGILSALVSLIIGYPSLKLKPIYFLLLTWGFVEIVRATVTKWVSLTGGTAGLIGIPSLSIVGIPLATKVPQYYFALVFTIVSLLILYRLENSRFGLTLKSMAQAEDLGESVGINTFAFKMFAFAISSFFLGLTGALYAHTLQYISPSAFSIWLTFYVMMFCYIGGTGSFAGPIVGSVFLSLLTEPLRGFLYYERVFYAIAIILVVLFLPGGLISLPAKLSLLIKRVRRLGKPSPSELKQP